MVNSAALGPTTEVLTARRQPLLFLCHRIPYPPNKGDKIRSFHLLRHLSHHYDIHLGAFVDDPDDWRWVGHLDEYCATTFFRPLSHWKAKLRSIKGLFCGQPLSVPFYADSAMSAWVGETVAKQGVQQAIVYSAVMGQFLPAGVLTRTVVDFVDVDSDKWRQYAERKGFPMSWVYRREARRLFEFEEQLTRQADAALFVSAPEAELFRVLSPDVANKVDFYNNGVDTAFFDPGAVVPESHAAPEDGQLLVFTGAMDYWPNIDAVVWFAQEVLPALQADHPEVRLVVVGGNPSREVLKLQELPGVEVTGRVPDVRPYLARAVAAIAPMRIARGVQNKVLEAMAMARPVLVSDKGLEGIDAVDGEHVLLANTVDEYRQRLEAILNGSHDGLGDRARALVCRDFSWEASLPKVVRLLDERAVNAGAE